MEKRFIKQHIKNLEMIRGFIKGIGYGTGTSRDITYQELNNNIQDLIYFLDEIFEEHSPKSESKSEVGK